MATHTMIWSIQLCTLWWTVTHAEYYRSRSYSKFLLIFTIRASKLTSYLSIKASDPSPDHLCACVCVRARACLCVYRGVFTHPLGVSRSSGAAQHQNQQRADPPPRAARSLHPDGHTAAESRLITESPAWLTERGTEGLLWAVRLGSAQFGSVRFSSAPLSSQGVRTTWSCRASATCFGMERQTVRGGQVRNIQHHTSGGSRQNKSLQPQRPDEVCWHVFDLTQTQQD